jgi:membrane-associated phospholipid phosphatase
VSRNSLRPLAVAAAIIALGPVGAACQTPGLPVTACTAPASMPLLDVRDGDLYLLAGAGVAAVICKWIENDVEMSEHLGQPPLESISDAGNDYGSGSTLGGAALVLMGVGSLMCNERLTATGDDLMLALITAWVPVWSIKPLLDVRRPNGGHNSFPSGHTATAFAAAPVLAYHGGRVVGILAHAAGVATAMGRMEDSKHHAADVVMGAAIGLVAGRLAVRAREARDPATSGRSLELSATPGGAALTLRF